MHRQRVRLLRGHDGTVEYMADGWAIVIVVAFFGLLLGGLWWVGIRSRRRGVGDSILGAVDEIFHPAAYRPRSEIQAQAVRQVPAPSPGDPPFPALAAPVDPI